MFLLNNRSLRLNAAEEDALLNGGGGGGGGSGISLAGVAVPAQPVGSNSPTQQFDIGALGSLRPTDRFRGNLVRDIREAYDTYLTGSPVGRGGQYAVDAARRFGTTITEAARGYLATVGLPTLASAPPAASGNGGTGTGTGNGTSDLQKQIDDLKKQLDTKVEDKNPVELLLDALPAIFGQAVQNPPLQTQATGYTPVSGDFGGTSGSGIGMWLILGGVAIAGYFIYKRFKG